MLPFSIFPIMFYDKKPILKDSIKILNENFVIDHKGIMGNKGLELPEEELYSSDDILERKCQSLLMK